MPAECPSAGSAAGGRASDSPPDGRRDCDSDRRCRPTPFWGVFRLRGRRRGFRRQEEGENRYVDQVSGRVVALACLILIASILDALFTLLHISNGGQEINPVMRLALNHGPLLFLGLKIFGTAAGVLFLALHQNFRLSRVALRCAVVVYAGVLAYHAVLFLA